MQTNQQECFLVTLLYTNIRQDYKAENLRDYVSSKVRIPIYQQESVSPASLLVSLISGWHLRWRFPNRKKMLFLSTTAATATQEEERQVFHIGKNKQQHKACYLNELSKKSFSIPISTAWFRWFGNLNSDQHPKSERMALWSHLCHKNALKSLV